MAAVFHGDVPMQESLRYGFMDWHKGQVSRVFWLHALPYPISGSTQANWCWECWTWSVGHAVKQHLQRRNKIFLKVIGQKWLYKYDIYTIFSNCHYRFNNGRCWLKFFCCSLNLHLFYDLASKKSPRLGSMVVGIPSWSKSSISHCDGGFAAISLWTDSTLPICGVRLLEQHVIQEAQIIIIIINY